MLHAEWFLGMGREILLPELGDEGMHNEVGQPLTYIGVYGDAKT